MCSRLTSVSSPRQELTSNQESKSSDEAKTSGSKKFNSAHNSCRLFCSGVPVNSSRLVDLNVRTILDSLNNKIVYSNIFVYSRLSADENAFDLKSLFQSILMGANFQSAVLVHPFSQLSWFIVKPMPVQIVHSFPPSFSCEWWRYVNRPGLNRPRPIKKPLSECYKF